MATVSQVISLTENELEYLANHMGHDISVHRNFYRLQDSTLELAKVSRLLLAAEQGKMGSFAGKTLNDITFSDFPDYCEDDCGDSSGEVQAPEMEKLSSQLAPITPKSVTDETTHAPSTSVADETTDSGDISDIVMAGNTKMYKGKAVQRTEWRSDEMKAISDLIDQSVQSRKPPRKADVISCLSSFPQLKARKWIHVKFRVWAEAQKMINKKKSVKASFLSHD
ncbi:uncharacterized protein LOC135467422 [Liolophura sinensis]|uniref:uncharacterized protein LOC135467422 n=1 Tax=Liolophura sinensis TaxID=3198878 RepID=UPI0031582A0D